MRVLAIGDLHLPGEHNKTMDVFGPEWTDHAQRIASDWDARVGADDLVLIPGDISWAMRLPEAAADLAWVAARTGRKAMVRGNHDYWWQSLSKVRAAVDPGCFVLQNDAYVSADGRVAVAGARLWTVPGIGFSEILEATPAEPTERPERGRAQQDDAKILKRELGRLELSLSKLPRTARHRVAMLHFPPTAPDLRPTPVTDLLERYGVGICVFGHLHHVREDVRFEGERNGVRYRLVSCDYLRFRVAEVLDDAPVGHS